MHLVAGWNPKLLNKFLSRVLECCYSNLATFPSRALPGERRHWDTCFVQSSSYAITQQERAQIMGKKKAQQTKPEAFADLTATAVWAPAGWLAAVRDAGWRSRLEACTKLGGAGGVSPSQVGSPPLCHDKCSWKSSMFLQSQSVLYDFHKGCRYKQTQDKIQEPGGWPWPHRLRRLRLCHTAVKYKLKTKKHLFSHPAESLNVFQQWVGHEAVFLKWKCCSSFLLLISKAGNNAESISSIKKLKSILQRMILVKPWFG